MIYDVTGLAGVAAILVGYVLLQGERVTYDDYRYLLLNGGGAALVMVSLVHSFNLAAFLLEGIWLAVSVYGAVRRWNRDHARG